MKYKAFIGIDVSKGFFDVVLKVGGSPVIHQHCSNDPKGVRALLKFLKSKKIALSEGLFCMEHTGIYTYTLLEIIHQKGGHIWLEQALNIKRSLGVQRGKNDKVDATRIAEYASRFYDKASLWQPARKQLIKLKSLVSLRERLIKAQKLLLVPMEEIRQAGCSEKALIEVLTDPVIQKVKAQLCKVEQQIDQLIHADEHLNRLEKIITSVDGVGKVTAWQMIITTNEFKDFTDSRKFACYSGVVPFDHSSGTSIRSRSRVSHMANKKMKQLLHMSALSATVMEGELNAYYQRKVAEGKNKMLVLNNIRNKLVHRVFVCVRENRLYEKTYTHMLA